MCQAVPRRVLQVDGPRAEVDYDGVPTWVTAAGIADLEVGEYVVVYAGQALEKMDTAEAEEMLAWYADLETMLEEAEAGPMIDSPVSAPLSGSLRFIRYAFMPNRLRYCGGDDNRTLFEYGIESAVDGGLTPLLRRFNGALPYLQLIARANGIADPFDARVVEAYWIGNSLLDTVEVRQLYDHLLDRFGKQLQGRTRQLVLGKAPAGARPHHSFHVLDVHSRVGELGHSLQTLDSCRVSWGQVAAVDGAELLVDRQPLLLELGKLVLGTPQRTRVVRQVTGRGFADAVQADDWVSLHWGWVCEVLTAPQQANVARYTQYHLALANQTL